MSDYLHTHAHNFEYHTTWQNGARKRRRFPKRPKVMKLQYDINMFLKTAEEREDVPSTKNGIAESSENVQQREDSLFIIAWCTGIKLSWQTQQTCILEACRPLVSFPVWPTRLKDPMWSINSTSVLTGAQFVVEVASVVLYYSYTVRMYVCYVRFSWFNMTAELRYFGGSQNNKYSKCSQHWQYIIILPAYLPLHRSNLYIFGTVLVAMAAAQRGTHLGHCPWSSCVPSESTSASPPVPHQDLHASCVCVVCVCGVCCVCVVCVCGVWVWVWCVCVVCGCVCVVCVCGVWCVGGSVWCVCGVCVCVCVVCGWECVVCVWCVGVCVCGVCVCVCVCVCV